MKTCPVGATDEQTNCLTSFQSKRVASNNKMYVALRVKCLTFCPILIKYRFSWHIFIEAHNIKFHCNLSNGSHTDTCREMDMTKVRGAFCACADVPNKTVF
jgi:hypothetical protein